MDIRIKADTSNLSHKRDPGAGSGPNIPQIYVIGDDTPGPPLARKFSCLRPGVGGRVPWGDPEGVLNKNRAGQLGGGGVPDTHPGPRVPSPPIASGPGPPSIMFKYCKQIVRTSLRWRVEENWERRGKFKRGWQLLASALQLIKNSCDAINFIP
jgi:hypothetical protein